MITYLVRFIWVAAHVICLIEIDCLRRRGYSWWTGYILTSSLVAVFYCPELPGWEEAFSPLLVIVLLLRTCACLEALHHQTEDFPWWSRTMAGSFLLASMVIVCLALVRDSHWAGLLVEYRRYLQIWTFMAMASTELLAYSVGWLRNRRQDWHAIALLALAANHARVSIMAMTNHPSGSTWKEANWIAILIDTMVLLAWAFARNRNALSKPKQQHAASVTPKAHAASR